MKKLINYFILLSTIFTFFSCSIQKRTVNKGYFIQWNRHYTEKESASSPARLKTKPEAELVSEETEATSAESVETAPSISAETVSSDEEKSNIVSKKQGAQQDELQEEKTAESKVKNHIHAEKQFSKKQTASPISRELEIILNILLLLLFAGLTTLFIFLALQATGYLMVIYWVCALICFVVFVTQIFDVIQS